MRRHTIRHMIGIPVLAYLVSILVLAYGMYQGEPNPNQVFSPGGKWITAIFLGVMVMPIFGVIPYAMAGIPVKFWRWPQWSRLCTVAVFSLLVWGSLCMAKNPELPLQERVVFSLETAWWAWRSGLPYGIPLLALIYATRKKKPEQSAAPIFQKPRTVPEKGEQ